MSHDCSFQSHGILFVCLTGGHNLHFYIHLSSTTGLADAPRSTIWTCGGDRQSNGAVLANKGVNSDQKYYKPGICKEGSIVSIEYQGKDVVCSCGGKEYRRWVGQAQWPARAGISIHDPKPFALGELKFYDTAEKLAKANYGIPVWAYKKSISEDNGVVSKTTGQGWNGAGAYTAPTCKSGNCKISAKLHKQANTGKKKNSIFPKNTLVNLVV